jgi:hypothetical protein
LSSWVSLCLCGSRCRAGIGSLPIRLSHHGVTESRRKLRTLENPQGKVLPSSWVSLWSLCLCGSRCRAGIGSPPIRLSHHGVNPQERFCQQLGFSVSPCLRGRCCRISVGVSACSIILPRTYPHD